MVKVEEKVVEKFPTRLYIFKYVESAKTGETHRFTARLEHEYPIGSGLWDETPDKPVEIHCLRPDGVDDVTTHVTDIEGWVLRDITFDIPGDYEIWFYFAGDDYYDEAESRHIF